MSQEPDPLPESLPESLEEAIAFDSNGLVPAIARQHDSGEILMMAWMNRESLAATLASGQVTYWSRSRKSLWRKGERSGQTQVLKRLLIDCDGDTLLLEVDQAGVACHTGRRSCFYRALEGEALVEVLPVTADPTQLYGGGVPSGGS
ncbi:MAG: phosphoribosyl-AMP cyclohydrolase [Kiloniellales bacterium]|nr:phosphoribosyl-AMP cyclohydrolase [Kiloniellales bacterium]